MGQGSRRLIGVTILVVTAIIWGFSFVGQVLGSNSLLPFSFNGLRFLAGCLTMLPLCLLAEKPRITTPADKDAHKIKLRRTLLGAMLAGCALFGASTLQQCGISITRDPGKAGFITGLYTVLTPVAYWLIFKKKSSWNIWFGCILAAVGLYLICLNDNFHPHVGLGELLILGGAFLWTAHILVVDHFSDSIYAFRFSALQYLLCGGVSLVISLFAETVTLTDIRNGAGALFVSGVLSVGVAFTLQTIGQRLVPPAPAAVILSTEAVFAAVGGVLWNLLVPTHMQVDQTLSWVGVMGCGAMLLGIIMSQLTFPSRKEKKDLLS
ncbi:MAG: DMT family transporter [Ruminococcaceae bacterium]|nr:DMT family transporter [Oscillospiraceae bacterium]